MQVPNFLLHKIETELNFHGIEYTFLRCGKDKFGQPSEQLTEQIVLKGIYHESNSYITTSGSEASETRTKKSPMILCLFEDGCKVQQGDVVCIRGNKYKVSGVLDIQNYSVVADISLEEVV